MTYKWVLAIDPGGTSGVALRTRSGTLFTAPFTDPHELFKMITTNSSVLEQIVIERFAAKTISKDGLDTVRIVGGVEALAYVHGIPYLEHTPQARYPFKKEARELLKGRGVCIHEIESTEHLLRWEHDNGIG